MQICKRSFFYFLISFSIYSCQSTESTEPQVKDSSVINEVVEVPELTELSEPVFFSDTIPCADCPGIVYQLALTSDSTYIFSEEILGKKNNPYVQFGKTGNKDSVITLFMPNAKQVKLQVTDTGMLLMDIKAEVNKSKEDFTLDARPNGSFDLAQLYIIDGAYFYSGASAIFTPCGQLNTYQVKSGGASFDAENIFLKRGRKNASAPVYLKSLIRIKLEKNLIGMEEVMVIMEKVLSKIDSTDCR